MSKINDVLRLKFEAKLSHRDIALCLKIGPATVSEILTRFKNAKLNWPLPDDLSEAVLEQRLFPGKGSSAKKEAQRHDQNSLVARVSSKVSGKGLCLHSVL